MKISRGQDQSGRHALPSCPPIICEAYMFVFKNAYNLSYGGNGKIFVENSFDNDLLPSPSDLHVISICKMN